MAHEELSNDPRYDFLSQIVCKIIFEVQAES